MIIIVLPAQLQRDMLWLGLGEGECVVRQGGGTSFSQPASPARRS